MPDSNNTKKNSRLTQALEIILGSILVASGAVIAIAGVLFWSGLVR